MNRIRLSHNHQPIRAKLRLTGSKSESNRALIINALYPDSLELQNLSNSEDTQMLQNALAANTEIIDIHHAGTAMRFLTAFFALTTKKNITLTGSSRMQERPIGVLVDALRALGAKINFDKNEGFPPLRIQKSLLTQDKIALPAHISSQFISALMLIAPQLKNGLEITLIGKVTSLPYLQMTQRMMHDFGLHVVFEGNRIKIPHQEQISKKTFAIESDWSSASYPIAIAALVKESDLALETLRKDSLQGDAAVAEVYAKYFGVDITWNDSILQVTSGKKNPSQHVELDLNRTPDIAQTLAVSCFVLGMSCRFTGLETLKIKETDRLLALQNELAKFGAVVRVGGDFLELEAGVPRPSSLPITTYNDHRMAMAFAPLALLFPIEINHPQVVEKSYPDFWKDLTKMGFKTEFHVD